MRSINNDNGNISNINTNSFNINQSINSNISSSISISDNSNNSTNNKKIVIDKFEEQIKNIDDNVFDKIIKVFNDNVLRIKNELYKFIKDSNNIEENKEKIINIIKLIN